MRSSRRSRPTVTWCCSRTSARPGRTRRLPRFTEQPVDLLEGADARRVSAGLVRAGVAAAPVGVARDSPHEPRPPRRFQSVHAVAQQDAPRCVAGGAMARVGTDAEAPARGNVRHSCRRTPARRRARRRARSPRNAARRSSAAEATTAWSSCRAGRARVARGPSRRGALEAGEADLRARHEGRDSAARRRSATFGDAGSRCSTTRSRWPRSTAIWWA